MDVYEHIEKAFNLISAMPVTGDNQERAAAAKEELRIAAKIIREAKNEEERTDENGIT